MKSIKVVLIDDDVAIRYAIKTLFINLSKKFDVKIELFSSSNGVEGLGNIYAVNPEVIVIDTTLPKYSGKEVVEFISSHLNFSTKEIVVLTENKENFQLPEHFKAIDKNDVEFTKEIVTHLKYLIKSYKADVKLNQNIESSNYPLINGTIHSANVSDILMHQINSDPGIINIWRYVKWFVFQFITSLFLSMLFIRYGKVYDANIEQKDKDSFALRVKTYPTLLTVLVSFIFLLTQFGLFVSGGAIIFGMNLQSIFALGSNEKGIEFNSQNADKFEYDSNVIEFTNEGVQLKGVTTIVGGEEETPSPTETVVSPEVTEEVLTSPTAEVSPTGPTSTPIPTATSIPTPTVVPTEEGILGIEDEKLPTSVTTFSTERPGIIVKDGVSYTHLESIIERSSINNDTSSLESPKTFINTTDTDITYQLSPDGLNWYYFSEGEDRWSKTTQGWSSSNTIQEINGNLNEYEEGFGSGDLYFKIFLGSNGNKNITLNELSVERELSLTYPVDNLVPEEPVAQEIVVGSLDFNLLEVEIFNAAYFEGNKVVRGKVLLQDKTVKAKYEISEEELSKYEAKVYYSAEQNSSNKELIGITDLYLNSRGEIEFTLIEPSKPGGFVSAEVTLKEIETTLTPTDMGI